MSMSLNQLEAFVAIARQGSLSRAAETLFLTKGAVSQALRELERRLGVRLFDRSQQRLILNHEGLRLLPMADELIHRARDIERGFSGEVKESDGPFLTVGCSKTIGNSVMPGLMAGFSAGSGWIPGVEIANTRDMLRMLSRFTLDIALLEGGERLPDIIFEPWIADDMIVIAPSGHTLADGGVYPARRLSGEKWIVREPYSGSREYFEHTLAPMLGQFSIAMTLRSPAAIVECAAQGLGVAFVSRLSAEQALASGRLACIHLEERFPRTFSLCYHAKKYHSTDFTEFLAYCRLRKSATVPEA